MQLTMLSVVLLVGRDILRPFLAIAENFGVVVLSSSLSQKVL